MNFNKRITLLFPLSLILYELPLYLSNNLFLPALPEITKSFQIAKATAQLSVAFWFLGASFFQVILGPLSDHYSRRKILLSGPDLCIFDFYVASTILIAGYTEIHEIMGREQAVKTTSWMGSISFFCLSTGFIFYSLCRKAIEMPKKAPMATTMAVFSMSQNLFGFLGSLMVRKLYF